MEKKQRPEAAEGQEVLRCEVIEGSNGSRTELFLCDCIFGMTELVEPGSVDVIVTSPPYNLGIKYRTYDDTRSREEYLAWTRKWAQTAWQALSDRGSFFLNVGAKPTDPWVPFEVAMVMREFFCLQNVIHWIKAIAIEKESVGNYPGITRDVAVGHYKPLNSNRFVNDCHEYVFHFTKHGDVSLDRLAVGVAYQDESNVRRWTSGGSGIRCRGNTWFIPYETIKDRAKQRPHPATFPPKLPEMCIRLHGLQRCNLVMDPFMGLGNTAIACQKLGKSCIGFEIDSYYLDVAVSRLRPAKTQLSIPLSCVPSSSSP